MYDDDDNKLERAIERQELGKFLLGDEPYFCVVKGGNEEPQNAYWALQSQVLPYLQRPGNQDFLRTLFSEIGNLMQTCPDRNRAIYCADSWVAAYCFALMQKRNGISEPMRQLPEIDIKPVAVLLKQVLESNKGNLLVDTRWAGDKRNSDNGMWGPIVDSALRVRDRFGGPDYIPANR